MKTVQREVLGKGQIRFKSEVCELLWSEPAPHVVVCRYKGHGHVELIQAMLPDIAAIFVRQPKVHLFIDAAEMPSYDTEYRQRWTTWFRENRARLASGYFLVGSGIIKMVIQAINLFAGPIFEPLSDRAQFEALIEKACRAPA